MTDQGRRASEFVFARLRYNSGDWDYNPKVAANLLNSIVEYPNIRVYPEEVVIGASSVELLAFPFLFMTGHKLVRFTREEREGLRKFVEHGGFLFSHELNGWGDEIVHDYLRAVEHRGRVGVLYSNKAQQALQREDNTKFGVNLIVYAMT